MCVIIIFSKNEAVKEPDSYGLVWTTKEILMILFLWRMLLLPCTASTLLSRSHDTHPLSPATAAIPEFSVVYTHPYPPGDFDAPYSEALLLLGQVSPNSSLLKPG